MGRRFDPDRAHERRPRIKKENHYEKVNEITAVSVALFLSLSPEQVIRDGQIDDFERFLNEERFPFNSECEKYIVIQKKRLRFQVDSPVSRIKVMTYWDLVYVNKALVVKTVMVGVLKILAMLKLKHGGIRTFLRGHFQLIKDQVISELIGSLDKKQFKIKYLVGTNSYLSSGLPSIFHHYNRGYKTILIWYSINSTPISKTDFPSNKYLDADLRDHIDSHFVWDEYQKSELEAQGARNVLIKGSMVFVPRFGNKKSHPIANKQKILFFEVAPHYAYQHSIYDTKSSILTLESLIKLRKFLINYGVLKLEIMVKPKRNYTKAVDRDYIAFLKGLSDNREIQLLKPDINLYEEISSANLVLAPPFSSPCVIAKEMRIPSYFFFMANPEWQLPATKNGIEVLRDFSSLALAALKHLKIV